MIEFRREDTHQHRPHEFFSSTDKWSVRRRALFRYHRRPYWNLRRTIRPYHFHASPFRQANDPTSNDLLLVNRPAGTPKANQMRREASNL